MPCEGSGRLFLTSRCCLVCLVVENRKLGFLSRRGQSRADLIGLIATKSPLRLRLACLTEHVQKQSKVRRDESEIPSSSPPSSASSCTTATPGSNPQQLRQHWSKPARQAAGRDPEGPTATGRPINYRPRARSFSIAEVDDGSLLVVLSPTITRAVALPLRLVASFLNAAISLPEIPAQHGTAQAPGVMLASTRRPSAR